MTQTTNIKTTSKERETEDISYQFDDTQLIAFVDLPKIEYHLTGSTNTTSLLQSRFRVLEQLGIATYVHNLRNEELFIKAVKKSLEKLSEDENVSTAAKTIKDIYMEESLKSLWPVAIQSLQILARRNGRAVRDGLKYEFKSSKHSIADYENKLIYELGDEGAKIIASLQQVAKNLLSQGKNKIIVINATFAGGGVAEMLQTIGPVLAEIGIELEWHIIYPHTEVFYDITKGIHNTIQGNDVFWKDDTSKKDIQEKLTLLEEVAEKNSVILQDMFHDETVARVFFEDPQVIPLVKFAKEKNPDLPVAWRLHIDISGIEHHNPGAEIIWKTFCEYLTLLNKNDVTMFQPNLVPKQLQTKARILEQFPGIDPLAPKNNEMSMEELEEHLSMINDNEKQILGPKLDSAKPYIVTGSRFDYWKGLPTVLKSFEQIAHTNPKVQLLVFGGYANDDPEGVAHFELLKAMWKQSPVKERITIVTNYSGRTIGALYKLASLHQLPYIAFSLKEGYNLMTNENEITGGASIVTPVGGLGRYKAGETALDVIEVGEVHAEELYSLDGSNIVSSAEALELEDKLASSLRKILVDFESEEYKETYRLIHDNARKLVYRTSVISMFLAYLSFSSFFS